jgi:predicted nucleic acid-binding protein
LGLGHDEARRRLALVERVTELLPEVPGVYERWRELVDLHQVRGVKVHDTRLVALMGQHGVTHVLTLNQGDFARYPRIVALGPGDVLTGTSQT